MVFDPRGPSLSFGSSGCPDLGSGAVGADSWDYRVEFSARYSCEGAAGPLVQDPGETLFDYGGATCNGAVHLVVKDEKISLVRVCTQLRYWFFPAHRKAFMLVRSCDATISEVGDARG